jgi:hypothetical protein
VIRLVITDGRRDLLDRMLASFDWYCSATFARTIVVNDSADSGYARWLEDRIPDAEFIHHRHRAGLAQAIRSGWAAIDSTTGAVVHLEDDCVFTRAIDLAEWVHPLTVEPHLAQVCLQRGPDEPSEIEAGGILQLYSRTHPLRAREHAGVRWTEQAKLFSLQPNVYRASLTQVGWPEHGGETEFTERLRALDPDVRFAYLDGVGAEPRYVHAGYCQRTPGWAL